MRCLMKMGSTGVACSNINCETNFCFSVSLKQTAKKEIPIHCPVVILFALGMFGCMMIL